MGGFWINIREVLSEASFGQHDRAEPDLLLMADGALVEKAEGAILPSAGCSGRSGRGDPVGESYGETDLRRASG